MLRQVHKERQALDPIPMIPYHFVIGNGRGMSNGEVAPTRRWPWVWGAHLSASNTRLNVSAIGICVIGNFETQQLGDVQFDALVALVKRLKSRYNIKSENVSFHGHTDGEHTKCPGKNFPRARVMNAIS